VVPYEDTTKADGIVSLLPALSLPAPGRHVHRQGTDYRKGDLLLDAGTRLTSPHLHSLASSGADPVGVLRRARWSLAATGDELVEVRDEPQAWQIRRSNAAAIIGEASTWGLAPRNQVVLADDRARIRTGLEKLLPGLDVLVLTGVVSAGVLDLIPGVLADLGAEVAFHKLAQRPGKPLWCGRLPGSGAAPGTVVFGLPGNPVSSLFSFRRYVLPWLLAFEGRPMEERRLSLGTELVAPPEGITVFLPWSRDEGVLDWRGSGDYSALARSSGFLEVNDGRSLREPLYYPWGGQ
jgi:molybdopterin molybdotransferase